MITVQGGECGNRVQSRELWSMKVDPTTQSDKQGVREGFWKEVATQMSWEALSCEEFGIEVLFSGSGWHQRNGGLGILIWKSNSFLTEHHYMWWTLQPCWQDSSVIPRESREQRMVVTSSARGSDRLFQCQLSLFLNCMSLGKLRLYISTFVCLNMKMWVIICCWN